MRQRYSASVLVPGLVLAAAVAVAWSPDARAVGFQRFGLTAEGLGVGNALAADAEHITSLAYNPSAIAFQEGLHLEGGLARRWGGLDAPGASSTPGGVFVNDLHATYRGPARSWALGLAVNRPFRMDSDFDREFADSGSGSQIAGAATRTELNLINVGPLVSYKIRPDLAIAVGPNYYRALDFEYSSLDGSGSEIRRTGNGGGFGGTAGIMFWRESWSAAASYWTGSELELDGSNLNGNSFHLPARARLGVKWRPNLWWSIHGGAIYTRWSQYDGLEGVDSGKDWDNTFGLRLGAIARFSDLVKARFGYSFDQGPKDDTTFDPRSDTGDRHAIHLGGTWATEALSFTFAYSYAITGSKDVSGARIPAYNGSYETSGHRLMLSVGYSPW